MDSDWMKFSPVNLKLGAFSGVILVIINRGGLTIITSSVSWVLSGRT